MALLKAKTEAGTALAAVGLLALAACDSRDRQPAARLEPGVGFFLNQDVDSASLAYGPANSDDLGLMLQCRMGSRRVQVSDLARRGARGDAVLTLASGAARSPLKAKVMTDEESGQPLASAQAPTDLPALAAFRRSGQLSVELAGRQEDMAANAAERASIARFFAACERGG